MNKNELLTKINHGIGFTHPAKFHADDILSACLLRLVNPEIKIVRSNVIPVDFPGIIFDIGLGDYDHHQFNAKIRESGIKYAAFGLLWKDLSYLFMDDTHAALFDAAFVSEIDRCDNGSDTNLLSTSIELFNPTWNSGEDPDDQFEKTVEIFTIVLQSLIHHFKKSTFIPRYCADIGECLNKAFESILSKITNNKIDIPHFANIKDIWENYYYLVTPNESPDFFERTFLSQVNRTYGKFKTTPFVLTMACLSRENRIKILIEIIDRRFFYINAIEPARQKCEEIYQKSKRKDLIILDQYMPYDSITESHEVIKAIIFPSDRCGYTILCVNMNQFQKQRNGLNLKKVARRMEFPVELRGKDSDVLSKEYPGLFFVHPSGYMASCENLEQAINFFEKVSK